MLGTLAVHYFHGEQAQVGPVPLHNSPQVL